MAKKKETKKETITGEDKKVIAKFLIREMNKGKGNSVAFCLNDPNPTDATDFISTGSSVLDFLITNRCDGGVPVGKLTEIVGEEASGKSLMCAQIIANCQKKGGIAVYMDTENAASSSFMKRLGVNISDLVYMQPGTIEEAFEAIEKTINMARAKNTDCPVLIVWDSIAATPPQAEIEGSYDANSRIGLMAKALALGLRKLTETVGREKVTLVFANQLKTKIGVMYGDPMTTPGGKAIPYHASVRVRLTKSRAILDESDKVKEVEGFRTLAKVFKTRLGPPMRKTEFNIMFKDGIDDLSSIRDCLWQRGHIEKRGGWMYMNYLGAEKKFREKKWNEEMKDKKFNTFIRNLLAEALIIKFDDEQAKDVDIDTNSFMEMESLTESLDELSD